MDRMDLERIQMIVRMISVVIAVNTAGLILIVAATSKPGKLLLRTYEEISAGLKKSRNGLFDYRKLEAFLERNGAEFHFGKWISPISYMVIRLVAGGMGMLLGVFYEVWLGFILAVIFFLLPDMMLAGLNSKDNERILPELKLVYHAMAMQIKAGVYVTDALAECYGSVKDGRLREALLTLSGDITMKADVEEALERFQGKFDNQYIDALCITILQALESGQAVDLLSDIAEQLKDMEGTIMNRKKGSLDRSITFYQLGILSAILVIVLYACVVHMMAAVVNFS